MLASGLDPNYPSRSMNHTFACSDLEIWQGHNRVVVERQVSHVERPDYFLIVTTAEQTGGLRLDEETSKSHDIVVVSVSQWREQQEVMLLMPAFSWVRGKLGTFFVEPSRDKQMITSLTRLLIDGERTTTEWAIRSCRALLFLLVNMVRSSTRYHPKMVSPMKPCDEDKAWLQIAMSSRGKNDVNKIQPRLREIGTQSRSKACRNDKRFSERSSTLT